MGVVRLFFGSGGRVEEAGGGGGGGRGCLDESALLEEEVGSGGARGCLDESALLKEEEVGSGGGRGRSRYVEEGRGGPASDAAPPVTLRVRCRLCCQVEEEEDAEAVRRRLSNVFFCNAVNII